MERTRNWLSGRCVVVCLLMLACAEAGAQAPTKTGRVEVIGFGGGNGGLPSVTEPFAGTLGIPGLLDVRIDEGSNFKWLAGGGVGVAMTRDVLVVGEFSYNRVGSTRVTYRVPGLITPFSVGIRSRFYDFTGGVHYQLPVPSTVMIPYLGFGVGAVRSTGSVDAPTFGIPGLSPNVSVSDTDVTVNFGGGVRFYISEKWGIRPEFKGVRVPNETYFRGSLGVFYQFR